MQKAMTTLKTQIRLLGEDLKNNGELLGGMVDLVNQYARKLADMNTRYTELVEAYQRACWEEEYRNSGLNIVAQFQEWIDNN